MFSYSSYTLNQTQEIQRCGEQTVPAGNSNVVVGHSLNQLILILTFIALGGTSSYF